MKKLAFILSIAFVAFASCDKEDSPEINGSNKRLNIESGIIHYSTTTLGMLPDVTISGPGTAELYFKDWGALKLETSRNELTYTYPTFINIVNNHETTKIDSETIYSVDYASGIILTQKGAVIEFMFFNSQVALESMSYKKVGTEEYEGYDCEIWKNDSDNKVWMYKGVELKSITSLAGITITKEAIEIDFNIDVPEGKFDLPDYPHKDMMGS